MNFVLSLDKDTNISLISNDGKHRSPSPSLVAMNVKDEDGSLPPSDATKTKSDHSPRSNIVRLSHNLQFTRPELRARFKRARVLLLHQLEFCMVKIGVEQMSRGPSFSPPSVSVPPSILNPERAADSVPTQGS